MTGPLCDAATRPLPFHRRRGVKMRLYGNEREGSLWSQQMQQTPSRDLVEKRETGAAYGGI